MARIRPETEVDRTEAALAAEGFALPLARGDVEITVADGVAATPVGQRLLVLLVNELARMKGVVRDVHLLGVANEPRQPGIPIDDPALRPGLEALVSSLNDDTSTYRAEVTFSSASDPAVRVRVGPPQDGVLTLAADGWRALVGGYCTRANWLATPPYGAALAASIGAAEVFKRLIHANGSADLRHSWVEELAFSTFNYGIDEDAAIGPEITSLAVHGVAVCGCGAGGTAALYVLAMQPALTGDVALIEPGRHKLSNLNRYLMIDAGDVLRHKHKLATCSHHLALYAPGLQATAYAVTWEQLQEHPWPLLLSTVDTVEARWAIQDRASDGAVILDGSVLDMLYSVLRVQPGGWCLECKHPYDPELPLKQRAARWGQELQTIRIWSAQNAVVSAAMIGDLASTQGRPAAEFAGLEGVHFNEVTALIECGETPLRTDVPSQAPVLPLSTTPVGALLAAEIAKHFAAPSAVLSNWIAHDLRRAPARPRVAWRRASPLCRRHD